MEKPPKAGLPLRLPGTVGDVVLEVRQFSGSPTAVFVFHGMGGSLESSLPRALATEPRLRASVIRFTTSRYIESPGQKDYAAMRSIFREKIYAQELEDVRRAIAYVLGNSQDLVGFSRNKLDVIFVGTSMGGISAAILAKEFAPAGIVIVNSGTWFRGADVLPRLVEGFPDIDRVKRSLGDFDGPLKVLRGDRDPIVSREAAQALTALARHGHFLEIPGLAHSFSDPSSVPGAGRRLINLIVGFINASPAERLADNP